MTPGGEELFSYAEITSTEVYRLAAWCFKKGWGQFFAIERQSKNQPGASMMYNALTDCERIPRSVPNFMSHKLFEACREAGCPVCRLEQRAVERYLDNQFYENVNSPPWRDHLRASHGFCQEHAWLGVQQRLGDALGFSIIYHDIVNSLLHSLNEQSASARPSRRRTAVLGKVPESLRERVERLLKALAPRKRCPACEHREQTTRNILSALVEDLPSTDMISALQASDGLCLPHLRQALAYVNKGSAYDTLITIHHAKLANLKNELAEFIRKNDYRVIKEGFGREGDAWLRAISMVAGSKKEK